MQPKRVLLKDIAQRAGLTVNTVSRALKGKDDISKGVQEYVQALALEMGYIPDVVAASLRSGYTKTIGVIFDNISNPYYMIMTEHINAFLGEEGYDIMVFTSTESDAMLNEDVLTKIIARRVDGVISFLKPTEKAARFVHANKIPLVVLGREADDIGIDSVYTDDYSGGKLVGEHLFNQGYKRVGYLGVPEDIMCSKKRAEGLVDGLTSAGGLIAEENIKFLNHGFDSIDELINEFIAQEVDAIFCFNDMLAYEVITKLHGLGLDDTKTIGVVGYDNIEDHLRIPVGLTSVSCDKKDLAYSAADMLLKRISNASISVGKIVRPTKLILRKTA